MKIISRNFYSESSDKCGAIWRFLSCAEKIAYYQYYNERKNIENMFCNDTNIVLIEKEGSLQITSGCFKEESSFFSLKRYSDIATPLETICHLIDEDKIVGFNTEFNNIPNYNDYLRKLERTKSHYAMLVGYDEEYFYVADSPFLLRSEFREDNMLTKVSQTLLSEEFDKQCNLIIAEKNPDFYSFEIDIKNLISKIITNYDNMPIVCGDSIHRYGCAAMSRLYELVKDEDPRLFRANLFISPFPASVIRGRRIMLKWYLEKHRAKFLSELTACVNRLINSLDSCAVRWHVISNSALRRELKNITYLPDKSFMEELRRCEDELYVSLLEFKLACDKNI